MCVPSGHWLLLLLDTQMPIHVLYPCICIHVCSDPYLYFPSMLSETMFLFSLSIYSLHTLFSLLPALIASSLSVLLLCTGQCFPPSDVFFLCHIQDLKLCSLHVLLFGLGLSALCTPGLSHASGRDQFSNDLHQSPAPLQP